MLLKLSNSNRNIDLNKILNHSEKLANDIEFCLKRFLANKSKWNKNESTIEVEIRCITANIKELIKIFNPSSLEIFLDQGISALSQDIVWIHLEYAAINTSNQSGIRIKNAFTTLARLFNDSIDLQPPCKVDLKGYVTDISKLYVASDLLVHDYRRFLFDLVNSGKSQKQLRDIKASTHRTLVTLIKNDESRDLLAKYGLDAFSKSVNIYLNAIKSKTYISSHFQLMLSSFNSDAFGRKTVLVKGNREIDFTELYLVSEALYDDIKKYSTIIGYSASTHLKPNSIRDKFSAFKRALPTLQTSLSDEMNEKLLSNGFKELLKENPPLKRLYDDPNIPNWVFYLIHEICNCLYPESTPKLDSFRDNLLVFPGIDRNRDLLADFSSIKDISSAVYTELYDLLESYKTSIDQREYSMRTIYHHYQQIKSLLNKYSHTFSRQHLDILEQYGIPGFGVENGLVHNHLLAELQSSVNIHSFNRFTAHTYRQSFHWLMREFDIPFNNIYPIKLSKTVKHKQRLNTDDFYTEEQCSELAFYTEKLLRDESTSLYHRILLNFCKIILKTGWNISPLINMECDDIVEVASPISNKIVYAVVLQKARAGYRNDTYTFNQTALKGDALKSAISDLLTVRDELTLEIRKETKHANFLFIYPHKGVVKKLEYSSLKNLNSILSNAGCDVPFITKKIRKGGANHIYRKVNKCIRKYPGVFNHSFSTFESHYLRVDPDQSRYSLNEAIRVMTDYFTGKEISSEIHIITDMTAKHHQIVPTGTCAGTEYTEEAKRYRKEHQKLHQSHSDIDLKMCADFLSCVWCKYFRVVVDAEHVWKLLSYRDYILQNMKLSVVDFDDSYNQTTNINILRQRVDEIVTNLRKRNNKAVEDGLTLLNKQGMHPDWEFANPNTSIMKRER